VDLGLLLSRKQEQVHILARLGGASVLQRIA
jgi:hypothetical protein